MKTKLTVAVALGGTLLATCFVSGSAQATSVPVLKSDAGMVTLVGRGGGRGGGMGRGGGGGGRGVLSRGGGGGRYAYGGGGGGKRYYGGGDGRRYYGGGGKRYSYKNRDHDYYKRYGHYGKYRRYGSYGRYGLPYIAYGYGGGCGWLYRNAIATGSSYWWNRYYECTGYY